MRRAAKARQGEQENCSLGNGEMQMPSGSPYRKARRLPDVIAAVQFMAAAQRPERKISDWSKGLSGSEAKDEIERWTAVFKEHPEFFLVYRLEGEADIKAALRVRYANKLHDAKTGKDYTQEEKDRLDKAAQDLLTTKPLGGDVITAMSNTAIALHTTAMSELAAGRWWVPILAAVPGFVGALIGALVAAHKP
jgi:hypothetical protein